MIGFLDKPGNYIVTNSNDCKNCGDNSSQNIHITLFNNNANDNKPPQIGDWSYNSSKNKMVCIGCNSQSMVINVHLLLLNQIIAHLIKIFIQK